ncbi:putative MFS transporter [Pseudovirgaria hyperparasitica]|uniref:Putative MFS transporter n=1 Tax=Pseudovirgaria hyperparasitica TaxID=470096 RepID=A0A6A6WD33_9PEZI|nr:putative MFS transporter [Pseudovirgaria hyperparasitica]KAF2760738.1 putative MFS transporter [Pseudovirgaria hyperparasitica]
MTDNKTPESINGSSPERIDAGDTEPPEIDIQAEKRLVRKLDLYIVPVVMLLYLLSFLDRVNIGNARLYGLESDLKLSPKQFQVAISILFVTYILSEVPSNLVLKKFRPSRWIAFITTSWGIIATLTGITHSYAGLLVCRLFLGAVEGGLFPGMAVYLTLFYTKRELALRIGYLFVSSALAGACGGLLAFAIGHMDGLAGLRGWRWIMILEGLPTIILGIATWWLLADDANTAYYLSPADRALMHVRRARQTGQTASAQHFHWADVRACVSDWTVWAFCAAQFGTDTMLYGFSTFLPTIIRALYPGHGAALVQALTIPVYALGAATYLLVARVSDRTQRRGVYAVSFGLVSIVGYALLISNSSAGVHYAGCFLVAMGLYVAVGLPLAWLPSNCPRYGKRTTATGLQLTIGNCAGIMASFLYPSAEGPRYVRGHAVTLGMVAFACIVLAGLSLHFSRMNARRARGEEDGTWAHLNASEIAELGDKNPAFVYAS